MKEIKQQSFGAAIKAVAAQGLKFFGAGGSFGGGDGLSTEDKEKRNKIAIPAMAEAIKALNPKMEKILKLTQTNENFCVGDTLTFADIDIFAWKLMMDDPTFNQYGDLKTSYFTYDISYINFTIYRMVFGTRRSKLNSSIKAAFCPALLKIAENVGKHPGVQEYLQVDGHMPYSGMNILW